MDLATTAPPAIRDRPRTKQLILDAAKAVLADAGFSAFGVNAIARRAGCDKQLIYRYYGGLDGVIDAIGTDLADLLQDIMTGPAEAESASYAELIEHLLLSLLDAFRSSSLLLRIAAWEVFDPAPATQRLAAVRGRALAIWIDARRGDLAAPTGVDTGAINATLIAAVQQLALSAQAVGNFSGVALRSESDWDRIRRVLRAMVSASYAAPSAPPAPSP